MSELIALRRHNIDLEACEIRIVETTAQLDTGRLPAETPKSRAGRRTVAFPAELVPEIAGTWSGSPSRGSGVGSVCGGVAVTVAVTLRESYVSGSKPAA